MAQLPALLPGQNVAISYDRFKETALGLVSSKDAKILNSLSLNPPRQSKPTGSWFVDAWYKNESILRLMLEQKRAEKLKRTISPTYEEKELIHFVPEAELVVKQALSYENPLEAEYFLNSFRWSAIESLKGQHYFDSVAVFAYGLMVLLQERNKSFSTEAGSASYISLYNQILENKA